jgi:hypothetical protein
MTTHNLLAEGAPIEAIATRLDALTHPERLTDIRALTAKDLRALYELTADRPAPKAHFVPPSIPDGLPVRHFGINSLPLFRLFEKRFLRDATTGDLHGYNHQALSPLTGPGYFVLKEPGVGEAAAIDYHQIPPQLPHPTWPKLAPNTRLPQLLVYGHMRDHMHLVSTHVSIGRAEKKGKPAPAWFALVREDPLP